MYSRSKSRVGKPLRLIRRKTYSFGDGGRNVAASRIATAYRRYASRRAQPMQTDDGQVAEPLRYVAGVQRLDRLHRRASKKLLSVGLRAIENYARHMMPPAAKGVRGIPLLADDRTRSSAVLGDPDYGPVPGQERSGKKPAVQFLMDDYYKKRKYG